MTIADLQGAINSANAAWNNATGGLGTTGGKMITTAAGTTAPVPAGGFGASPAGKLLGSGGALVPGLLEAILVGLLGVLLVVLGAWSIVGGTTVTVSGKR